MLADHCDKNTLTLETASKYQSAGTLLTIKLHLQPDSVELGRDRKSSKDILHPCSLPGWAVWNIPKSNILNPKERTKSCRKSESDQQDVPCTAQSEAT